MVMSDLATEGSFRYRKKNKGTKIDKQTNRKTKIKIKNK